VIYDLRAEAKLSRRELAERMGTTQSVISRLEEGGGARNRLDTLARVATALDRHLIVSFPEAVPKRLKDAVQVARPPSVPRFFYVCQAAILGPGGCSRRRQTRRAM